jgi:hypothetical protein
MIVIEIVLGVLGLILLLVGRLPLRPGRAVQGFAARLVGLLLMLPFPIAYLVGYNIGADAALHGKKLDLTKEAPRLALIEAGIIVACFVLAMVLALATAKPLEDEDSEFVPRRRSYREDDRPPHDEEDDMSLSRRPLPAPLREEERASIQNLDTAPQTTPGGGSVDQPQPGQAPLPDARVPSRQGRSGFPKVAPAPLDGDNITTSRRPSRLVTEDDRDAPSSGLAKVLWLATGLAVLLCAVGAGLAMRGGLGRWFSGGSSPSTPVVTDAKTAILGTWKHENGLDVLEFTTEGSYTIKDENGKIVKSGKYRVIDATTMEWEHTTPIAEGANVVAIKGVQPIAVVAMVRRTIHLSGQELVISGPDGSASRWHS